MGISDLFEDEREAITDMVDGESNLKSIFSNVRNNKADLWIVVGNIDTIESRRAFNNFMNELSAANVRFKFDEDLMSHHRGYVLSLYGDELGLNIVPIYVIDTDENERGKKTYYKPTIRYTNGKVEKGIYFDPKLRRYYFV